MASGARAGERVLLEQEMTVGREGADIAIEDDVEASRRHATLRPVEGGVEVVDLGSMNGTKVDGDRIEEPRVAGNGSTIQVGVTSFTVELPVADPAVTRVASAVPQDIERTVERAIPDPQVTAARPQVADPQVTAARPQPPPAPAEPDAGQGEPAPEEAAPAAEEAQPSGPPAPVKALLGFIFGAGPEKIPRRMLIAVVTWTLIVAALTVLVYTLVS